MSRLFAVYHETARKTEYANAIFDGLLLVSAGTPEEAREIVRSQMGSSFNDCVIEEIVFHEHKVVIEFWRTPPVRPPRRNQEVAA